VQVFLRVGGEFGGATLAAEVIRFSGVIEFGRRARGIHRHAADGIALGRSGRRVNCVWLSHFYCGCIFDALDVPSIFVAIRTHRDPLFSVG
jgi:hypothetical protein